MMNRQLSRPALVYFLSAFSAVLLLQAFFMPWWLLPVAAISLAWRALVFFGRLSFPSWWIKIFLVIASGVAIFLQYGFSVSIDVFVMLLLLGFSLKILELYHADDAKNLLYLAFFVLMTVFLYEQSFVYLLLVILVSLLILSAMVAIQSADDLLRSKWSQPLRKGLVVTLFSLPVMMIMFVAIPRLPPLWSMPLQKQQQARTGMSDSMSPGGIASLARSSELAFRAVFEGGVPDRRELYWYGMILDHFDGVNWTDSCVACGDQNKNRSADPVNSQIGNLYQVILEPHGGRWVYILLPSLVSDSAIRQNVDGIASYFKYVQERQSYRAVYLDGTGYQADKLLERSRYLNLPVDGNPRARELASRWRQESVDDKAVVQKALALYRSDFFYTLQPPILNDQRVDDFLFRTRTGFCEHFASSFVFLMRAAGIPSRVAVGYMGGEIDEEERYVTVRQYDAHAWAEVWFADSGWVRVDPTAAVSPDRIDMGFLGAYSDNSAFASAAGLNAFHSISVLNKLRLEMDRFDYLWSRWVLGYQNEEQQQLLGRLGLLSPLRIAVFLAGFVMVVFTLFCAYLYWRDWRSVSEHRATRRYRQLCEAYALLGVERMLSETPMQYAEKISTSGLPYADQFSVTSRQYYEWRYLEAKKLTQYPSADFMPVARRLYWLLVLRRFKVSIFDRS